LGPRDKSIPEQLSRLRKLRLGLLRLGVIESKQLFDVRLVVIACLFQVRASSLGLCRTRRARTGLSNCCRHREGEPREYQERDSHTLNLASSHALASASTVAGACGATSFAGSVESHLISLRSRTKTE